MNQYFHLWDRILNRIAFFGSVFMSLFSKTKPIASFLPLFLYYQFYRYMETVMTAKDDKNTAENKTSRWKWMLLLVGTFQVMVIFGAQIRFYYPDAIILPAVKIVLILITPFMVI